MLPTEWTRMAIASAVAVIAMSYLAINAGVVNSSVITRRIETARASIADAAASQHQFAFAIQAWARPSREKADSEPHLEHCLAID